MSPSDHPSQALFSRWYLAVTYFTSIGGLLASDLKALNKFQVWVHRSSQVSNML